MGISQKGQMFYTAWYNGVEFDKAFFNGLRILGRPDNTPYLLAKKSSPKTIIKQGDTSILVTNNAATQVLSNTLDNQFANTLKFNINFKLHSDALASGYNYLLDIPGLVKFLNYNGRLAVKAHWLSYMYMVSNDIIVDGWNDISFVGDGVSVILTVNNNSFVFGEQAYTLTLTLYNGFSASNYVAIDGNKFDASATNWNMGISLYTPSNTSANRKTNRLFGPTNSFYTLGFASELQYNNSGYYVMGYGLSSNGSSWNQGWIQNNDIHLAYNSWHWFLWIKRGSAINCYHSVDAINYELHTTASINETLYHDSNAIMQIGNTSSNSSYYMRGYMNITDTFFDKNGTKTFDGKNAVLGTDYNINGSLTTSYSSRTDFKYPFDIQTGTLKLFRDVSKIKELNANKVD